MLKIGNPHGNLDIPYSIDSSWKALYGSLLIISELSGALIPLIFLYSAKCRHHPASLILIICLLEMITCYQIFIDSVCLIELLEYLNSKIHYHQMMKTYMFNYDLQPEQINKNICRINQGVILFCVIAQLNYYCILTIDLIITLKRPFMNTGTRLKFYHLAALTSSVILYYIGREVAVENCNEIQCKSNNFDVQSNLLYQLGILGCLIIVCVYISIKDMRKCRKLNVNIRKNRQNLYVNHLILVITLLIIWMVPVLSKIVAEETKYQVVGYIYFSVMLLHPSIFLIIRLRDPYFKCRVKIFLLSIFCKAKFDDIENDDKLDTQQEWIMPLGQLVQNETNQETVANILSSILTIVDYQMDYSNERSKCIKHNPDNDRNSLESPLLYDSVQISLKISLDYQIIEYCPGIFQQLRQMDGIDYQSFQDSLRLDKNTQQISKTQESLGKSGSFFFFSYDKKLILKTLSKQEIDLIRKTINDYYNYIKCNPESIIARFYGIYTINIEGFSSIHLVLMENLLFSMKEETKQYDLKGSLVNRKQKVETHQIEDVMASRFSYKFTSPVLKDVNFIQSTDIFIELSKVDRDSLFLQLKSDSEFLLSHQIMDYSLLIGICDKVNTKNNRIYHNRSKSYSFGIIDYTQQFTWRKKIEQIYKTLMRRQRSQISCVDPDFYYQRFYAFLNSVIIINNYA